MKTDTLHLSPPAIAIAVLCYIAIITGMALMDQRVNRAISTVYAIALLLAGLYALFGLKNASPWEKAVVVRLG